ncbi:MAG: DUF3997 domain-containing protein [Tannerellaceae bacterium]|nr:DUF3997 domain-containing protein [Tannerellaceae bacterium]
MDLCYKLENGDYIGVAGSTVFAAGYNDDFIIVKQHPLSCLTMNVNRNVTNYYIIPLKYKVHDWPYENRIGPLSEKEFQAKRKELKIPDSLTFTRTFKKLE